MKLSKPQERVMQWLGQGWSATHTYGSTVEVNGKRICSWTTLKVLERHGLVEQESRWHWRATQKGRDYWEEKAAGSGEFTGFRRGDETARLAGT